MDRGAWQATVHGSYMLDAVAWYSSNSGGKANPVKQKRANELGLYDMTGNVSEWCYDWISLDFYSSSPQNNPTGPSSAPPGTCRVCRGGSWYIIAQYSSVSNRDWGTPDARGETNGFRVVCIP